MRLVVQQFMTLDGVTQAPGAPQEDTSGGFTHGGWLVPFADEDMGKVVVEWFADADAFLLGRRTYEIFAAHWPLVTDPDDPIAGALNGLPKHVVSGTLRDPTWRSTSVIAGDPVPAVRELLAAPGRELQVHGSGTLARALLAADLVDELRLITFPVALGTGRRMLDGPIAANRFALTGSRVTSTGAVAASYARVGPPEHGSFALDATTSSRDLAGGA